jgi:FAD/FMN-containing dehydrogenase
MDISELLKKETSIEFSTSSKILNQHSKDTSIFQVNPEIVVFPKNSNQIQDLVKFTNKHKKQFPTLSLTCRAAGTDMTGGPLNDSIILNFTKYMNKIISFKPKNKIITVQPGLLYKDFEPVVLSKNLILPSYPASKNLCALGGMIANNAGGEKSLAYGKTNKYVKSLKVILSDGKEYKFKKLAKSQLSKKLSLKNIEGEIYNKIFNLIKNNQTLVNKSKPIVSKNSAGYYLWDLIKNNSLDLTQLFTGSQGTLGIITEIELSLIPTKKHSRLIVCFLSTTSELTNFVNLVLPHKPESLETFDNNTLKLALKFLPDIAKKLKTNAFSLAWSFRKEAFKNFFKIPKFTVLVEITSNSQNNLQSKINKLSSLLSNNKIKHLSLSSEKEGQKYWTIRRESFNLLRNKVKNKQATAFIDDFAILPKYLPKFWPKLEKILFNYKIKTTIIGHAGSGNFHIIPLMDLSDPIERKKIPKVSEKVYSLVLKYKGTITAEHNDGLIRSPYLPKMFSQKMFSLFKKTKLIFDSNNIFNPHKKTDSSLDFTMKHIKTS